LNLNHHYFEKTIESESNKIQQYEKLLEGLQEKEQEIVSLQTSWEERIDALNEQHANAIKQLEQKFEEERRQWLEVNEQSKDHQSNFKQKHSKNHKKKRSMAVEKENEVQYIAL